MWCGHQPSDTNATTAITTTGLIGPDFGGRISATTQQRPPVADIPAARLSNTDLAEQQRIAGAGALRA